MCSDSQNQRRTSSLARPEVSIMTKDDRDTLQVLKSELEFIEKGGCGRSVRTPWQPTSVFQDSLTCINFADEKRTHPCNECLLIDFVPPENRNEIVPCHHIPLNAAEQTIDELEWKEDQGAMEEAVKDWLRSTIKQLEERQSVA